MNYLWVMIGTTYDDDGLRAGLIDHIGRRAVDLICYHLDVRF